MKEVTRYKCDYCDRIRTNAETIEKHEKECLHNPNCVNCYMCMHAVKGGYEDFADGSSRYNENLPYCTYEETPLPVLRSQGFTAENCEYYERSDSTYEQRYEKDGEVIERKSSFEVLSNRF